MHRFAEIPLIEPGDGAGDDDGDGRSITDFA